MWSRSTPPSLCTKLCSTPGYLGHYAAPDQRDEDERRLMREVGVWIGERVFGRGIGKKLLERVRPLVVVRVAVPAHFERLSTLPLEVAQISDKPMSLQALLSSSRAQARNRRPLSPLANSCVSSPSSACPLGVVR